MIRCLGWLAIGLGVLVACGGEPEAPLVDTADTAAAIPEVDEDRSPQPVVIRTLRPPRRPSVPPQPELLAAAREAMGGDGLRLDCGPYTLITDSTDSGLLDACQRLATGLDQAYGERLGVEPMGEPAEAIVLFDGLDAFRTFVRGQGWGAVGYAGVTRASQGVLVLYAGSKDLDDVLETLVHELCHLLHHRALGGGLPRWLSEGLADSLGDTANPGGLEPLAGVAGAEAEAGRLRAALARGEARAVAELVTLDPDAFDSGTVSYDYELSTFLVRFLLLDPELGPRFRAWLQSVASGGSVDPGSLEGALEVQWTEVDRRFRGWFESAAR